MSLDKSIEHGKEHRCEYYGSKRCDRSCRNHGSCPYCQRNRLYKKRKQQLSKEDDLNATATISDRSD